MNKWLLALASLAMAGCTQIPPASVGVRFNAFSGISEKIVKPQVVYHAPWERVIIYPTSIKNATFVKNPTEGSRREDDSLTASTSEGGEIPIDLTVAWHVDPANVARMFESFGTEDLDEIQETFIRYYAAYSLNVVSGTRTIFDVTSKERASLGGDVKAVLAPLLADYGITVDDVYIGEVYPSADMQKKVNERLNKFNELTIAKNKLLQAKIDAETIMTNAKKQATLNELLSQQGDSIIALKRYDNKKAAIEKWDGAPPTVGDGLIPFTNIKLR